MANDQESGCISPGRGAFDAKDFIWCSWLVFQNELWETILHTRANVAYLGVSSTKNDELNICIESVKIRLL